MHLHRDPNLGGIFLALGQSIVIGAAELRPGWQFAIDPRGRVFAVGARVEPDQAVCDGTGTGGGRRDPELRQYSHLPPAGEPHR